MIKPALLLATLLTCLPAHAYEGAELLADCQAADALYQGEKNSAPQHAIRSTRCIAYISGIADGYAIGHHLAKSVGVGLGAFCLPDDSEIQRRLVGAVLRHLERLPNSALSQGQPGPLVAGALAKAFPCTE
ncbi:MAG: Rap1a/Tai family immunity protein [Dechloromonas sp.]|nr:Rap1a/Tai family immunity protein [Dechloromonas sp.]